MTKTLTALLLALAAALLFAATAPAADAAPAAKPAKLQCFKVTNRTDARNPSRYLNCYSAARTCRAYARSYKRVHPRNRITGCRSYSEREYKRYLYSYWGA